ncbi:UNKNOWN [Stylonychia lemnae]|uniref:Uncharacterized protein n=1 Tax=Stylonychia lemnae TaxID=5949 RepID=A0A077ZQK7_STYLE|nr:UNKNOWN [Stylonychia lemnae]|eukprot:CDW72192.1 UNKNOWN [Stylonychia lemnae]
MHPMGDQLNNLQNNRIHQQPNQNYFQDIHNNSVQYQNQQNLQRINLRPQQNLNMSVDHAYRGHQPHHHVYDQNEYGMNMNVAGSDHINHFAPPRSAQFNQRGNYQHGINNRYNQNIPMNQYHQANEGQLTNDLKTMVDSQNQAIVQMINKIQEDKEFKMKQKNMELMQRIKTLERKKRRMNGEDISDGEEDDIMEMMNVNNNIHNGNQYLQQQQMINPALNQNYNQRAQIQNNHHNPMIQQAQMLEGNGLDDQDSIFALADSLEPGTYVPIVPYEENGDDHFVDNPFYDAEYNIKQIKERLRRKVGEYGNSDGLTLQERVQQKLSNYHNGTLSQAPQSASKQSKTQSLFLGEGQIENQNDDRSNLKSRESIKFQDVALSNQVLGNGNGGGFMGKFLKKIDNDKQLQNDLYAKVRRDIPKYGYAELVRDFRIDEEIGMEKDKKLEPYEKTQKHLSLLDKIQDIQRERIQKLILADQAGKKQGSPLKGFQAEQVYLIKEILDYEKEDDQILALIDRKYPNEEESLKWLIAQMKPFFLTLMNETRYDYSRLILDEAKKQYGYADEGDKQNSNEYGQNYHLLDDNKNDPEVIQLSRDNLMRKFEAKLKILVQCFEKVDVQKIPASLLKQLNLILNSPKKDELSLMEWNRLEANETSSTAIVKQEFTIKIQSFLSQQDKLEMTMLIGMYVIGRILTIKLFLKPNDSGLGILASGTLRKYFCARFNIFDYRNLKIFATVMYSTFQSFIIRSIKVKRTDFRNDSDMISKALFDKYLMDKYLMDLPKKNELEQSMIEMISKIIYKLNQ